MIYLIKQKPNLSNRCDFSDDTVKACEYKQGLWTCDTCGAQTCLAHASVVSAVKPLVVCPRCEQSRKPFDGDAETFKLQQFEGIK